MGRSYPAQRDPRRQAPSNPEPSYQSVQLQPDEGSSGETTSTASGKGYPAQRKRTSQALPDWRHPEQELAVCPFETPGAPARTPKARKPRDETWPRKRNRRGKVQRRGRLIIRGISPENSIQEVIEAAAGAARWMDFPFPRGPQVFTVSGHAQSRGKLIGELPSREQWELHTFYVTDGSPRRCTTPLWATKLRLEGGTTAGSGDSRKLQWRNPTGREPNWGGQEAPHPDETAAKLREAAAKRRLPATRRHSAANATETQDATDRRQRPTKGLGQARPEVDPSRSNEKQRRTGPALSPASHRPRESHTDQGPNHGPECPQAHGKGDPSRRFTGEPETGCRLHARGYPLAQRVHHKTLADPRSTGEERHQGPSCQARDHSQIRRRTNQRKLQPAQAQTPPA